jgi:hypothetical protein
MRAPPILGFILLLASACKPTGSSTAPGGDGSVDPATEAAADSPAEGDTPDAAPAVVTATLHNLCDKPQQWVLIEGDVTPDPSAGQEILPGATTKVELGPDQWVARKDEAGQWSSRARTNADGGHVWMSSSCQGVASSDEPDADPVALDAKMRETAHSADAK